MTAANSGNPVVNIVNQVSAMMPTASAVESKQSSRMGPGFLDEQTTNLCLVIIVATGLALTAAPLMGLLYEALVVVCMVVVTASIAFGVVLLTHQMNRNQLWYPSILPTRPLLASYYQPYAQRTSTTWYPSLPQSAGWRYPQQQNQRAYQRTRYHG